MPDELSTEMLKPDQTLEGMSEEDACKEIVKLIYENIAHQEGCRFMLFYLSRPEEKYKDKQEVWFEIYRDGIIDYKKLKEMNGKLELFDGNYDVPYLEPVAYGSNTPSKDKRPYYIKFLDVLRKAFVYDKTWEQYKPKPNDERKFYKDLYEAGKITLEEYQENIEFEDRTEKEMDAYYAE